MKILIKEHRSKQNLSQKQLSELTGISERMLRDYETGLTSPRLDTLKNIATTLKVKLSDLYKEI